MPEPETFDLDAAFRALERDVASISSPRGAGRAVAVARRRRRTTIAVAAAVAVIAMGGAALATGNGRDRAVGPSDEPLPSPAPLSAAALEDASSGWMSGWATPSQRAQGHAFTLIDPLRCIVDHDATDTLNSSQSTGSGVFTSGSQGIDYVLGLQFGAADIDAAQGRVQELVAGCRPATTSERRYVDGSTATYAQVPGQRPGRDFYVWTARHDDRIGLMITTGSSTPPDDATVARMDDFLVGALQVDGTVTGDRSPSSSASASASSAMFIGSDAFASALGSWQSGWSATSSSKVETSTLPCGVDPTRDADYGRGTALGADGQQEVYGFATTDLADQTAQSVAVQLRGCPSYDVAQVALPGGGTVMVASSNDPSSGMVVWLLQQNTQVGWLTIPAGDTPPPDSVSRAVASLIVPALTSAAGAESGPPQSQTIGPSPGTVRPQRAPH